MAGRLIRHFLYDGDAEGIQSLEISNMTIKATLFPRPLFTYFKKQMQEAGKPGVYLIYGEDYEVGSRKLYIGEGDPVGPRLSQHYGNKEFWTSAIVFTSKDEYVTKTQIQWLEAKLIGLASKGGSVVLDNGNMPAEPRISDVDRAEVSTFLDSILLLMRSIGVDFFTPVAVTDVKTTGEEVYTMKYREAEAKMVIKDGKYVLLKGSTVVSKEVPAAREPLIAKRKFFLDGGLVSIVDDKIWTVNQNLEFDSASYAASVVAGLGVNGLINWKIDGKTLKQIEASKAKSLDSTKSNQQS